MDAAECAVLSFGQSALAAKQYVEAYCAALPLDRADISCELWNIKEGHTSSVWQVRVHGIPGAETDEFIVNVARDTEAGRELKATSAKMLAIARLWPKANLAKVLSVDEVPIDFHGVPIGVKVTRNELIRDCYEIHQLVDRLAGRRRLVLVERFLAPEKDRPSHIRSIRGRELTEPERRRVKNDVNGLLARIRRRFPVGVDFNDGDVVWNGKRGIVVAIR
jgi:hypothetical protein